MLSQQGYNVTILTNIYSQALLNEDYQLLANTDINYISYSNLIYADINSYLSRTFNKLGRWLNYIGFENKYALGYSPNRCLKLALENNADLYICHQELPSYIGTLLLKKKKKVAFDFEDWYREDLLITDRRFRPQTILENVERKILTGGNLTYTTSIPLAIALAKRYNSSMPAVIYNSFPSFINKVKKKTNGAIKLIWLSQTIGPGRGIEQIIESLNNITNRSFELNLRGNISSGFKQHLSSLLTSTTHQIIFLPLIANKCIQEDLTSYDIGLALELSSPKSRDLTITNKIFHYLSVGLPVIASNTLGQLSLSNDFKPYIKYFNDGKSLESILKDIDIRHISNAKVEVLRIYNAKYDWNNQKEKLKHLVKNLFN